MYERNSGDMNRMFYVYVCKLDDYDALLLVGQSFVLTQC